MAKKTKKRNEGLPLFWVAISGIILFAVFSWGCLASAYAGSLEQQVFAESLDGPVTARRMRGRGVAILISAIVTFAFNLVVQIPNFAKVITWNLTNRKGMLIALLIIQLAVVGVAYGLKIIEQRLERPVRRRSENAN